MDEITLFADARHCSPWVLTVWTALKEKNIPFNVETFNLERGEHKTAEFASRTHTAKVPTLRRGDLWIAESLAILEYLDEAFAPPQHRAILPADLAARARDRQILSWLRTDLLELRRCMPYEGLFVPMETPAITPRAREEAAKLLTIAAARLRTGQAQTPTWADYELAFTLRRLIHYRHYLAAHDDVVAFSDRIWQRPSVQSWVTQDRK